MTNSNEKSDDEGHEVKTDYSFFNNHDLVLKGVDYPFVVSRKTGKKRFWDDLNESEQKAVHSNGYYIDVWEQGEDTIRLLNAEEKNLYHSAVVTASVLAPSFRDIIALLRPVVDRTAKTAYVDESARMGLGDLFFNEYSLHQRATAILHEGCHVLYRHFFRSREIGDAMNSMMNVAQDFEINCGLRKLEKADTSSFVHPDDKYQLDSDHPLYAEKNGQRLWPKDCQPHMTFEQHYSVLRDLNDNADPDCPIHSDDGESSDQSGEESGEGEGSEDQDADKSEGESDDGADSADDAGDEDGEGSGEGEGSSDEGEGKSDGEGSGEGSSSDSGDANGSSDTDSGSSEGDSGDSGDDADKECSCRPQGCGEATDERSEGMDEAGVEKASDVEKDSAIRNTKERIIEEQKRTLAAGRGANDSFLSFALDNLKPPKTPWQAVLRNLTVHNTNKPTRGRGSYTYKRVNRRMSSYRDWRTGQKFIFPGSVTFVPKVMLGIDTSGSMSGEDYAPLLSEIEGVVKSIPRAAHGLSVFSVDTEVSSIQEVNSVHDIDLYGGGGTRMSTAFEYVNKLPGEKMPDLVILATDGGLMSSDWDSIRDLVTAPEATYKTIILVTQERAFKHVPDSLKEVSYVLDISD